MSEETLEPGERVICIDRLVRRKPASVGVVQQPQYATSGAPVPVRYSFGIVLDSPDRLVRLDEPDYDGLVSCAWRGLGAGSAMFAPQKPVEPVCACRSARCPCGGHCNQPAVMHLFSTDGELVTFCESCGDDAFASGDFAVGDDSDD